MKMNARSFAVALSAAVLSAALPASAQQGTAEAPTTQRAHTLKTPRTDGKVLGSVKRGTDAAGRGIDRAGDATLDGVNTVSESASRPLRRAGNYLGDKLDLSSRARPHVSNPVGPQGNGP